jgi:kynurenine formamidase
MVGENSRKQVAVHGQMSEASVLDLFRTCSNADRWGSDDELGTANFITPEKQKAAAQLVITGRAVSLGRHLSRSKSATNPIPMVHRMLFGGVADPIGFMDEVQIAPHGFAITHVDAVAHVSFEGSVYNNRTTSDVVTPDGLRLGSILPLARGLITRGVLLDIAAARGVDWLEPGEGIEPDDLEGAERLAGVVVSSGDALFVRSGLEAREASQGEENPNLRAGLTARCLPWLYEREVAIYSGDCVDQIPSGYQRVPLPLHQVGLVAMGLVMLDNTLLTELTQVARDLRRHEFMLTCAPLPIPGGTGSPVNPIAIF